MKKLAASFVIALLGAAAVGGAREAMSGASPQTEATSGNIGYDGRLAFVRLRYASGFSGFGRRGGRELPWAHDYPTADIHMMKIINELTSTAPHVDGSNIFSLDDPGVDEPPDFVHVRARLLVPERRGGARPAHLPPEGGIHHLRRLP